MPARLATCALIAALLSGCGSADAEDFAPEAPLDVDLETIDLDGVALLVESLLGIAPDAADAAIEARRRAEGIEAVLLRAKRFREDAALGRRAEALRSSVLFFAATFPDGREPRAADVRRALAFLLAGRGGDGGGDPG